MMLIVASLHLAGFFQWVAHLVIEHLSPQHLLPGVIFTSGILSAFLVNDVVCLVMAPLILGICKRMKLHPLPYLLGLATASNIGSAATITGNPQNILIGSVSGISYRDFVAHLGPVALIGLFVDWALLHWIHLRSDATGSRPLPAADSGTEPSTRDPSGMAADGDARCIGRVSVGISAAAGRRRGRSAVAGAAPPRAKSNLRRCRLVAAGAVSGPVPDSRRRRASGNYAANCSVCAERLNLHNSCDLRGGGDAAVEHRQQRADGDVVEGAGTAVSRCPHVHGSCWPCPARWRVI